MINIAFDYDGTLHDSLKIYAPAFRKCCELLKKNEAWECEDYTDETIKKWIGMDAKTMWNTFMPQLSQEKKDKYSTFIGNEMLKYINEGKAELYAGAEAVLSRLKSDYRLIFLSSCKINYMEAHIRAFSLDKYFSDFYCTEAYGFVPKYKIFETIKQKYEDEFIIIGDRYSDMEVSLKFGLKAIGCVYGYGNTEELKTADYIVETVEDILNILL